MPKITLTDAAAKRLKAPDNGADRLLRFRLSRPCAARVVWRSQVVELHLSIRGQAAPHDLLYLPCNDFGRRP